MIHMLIGIQGSGKSTFAKKLQKEINCKIISTDYIRANVKGIEEKDVWPMVYKMVYECVINNEDAIYDATNITPKVRKRFVDEVSKLGAIPIIGAYYFKENVDLCHERVIKRNTIEGELYLPPEVVFSYHEKIVEPSFEEGFYFIKTITNGEIVEEKYEEKHNN